jgi:hypothetical protein
MSYDHSLAAASARSPERETHREHETRRLSQHIHNSHEPQAVGLHCSDQLSKVLLVIPARPPSHPRTIHASTDGRQSGGGGTHGRPR